MQGLSIFKNDEFFIDEKVLFLRMANEYKIYNNRGTQIGRIMQKISGFHKFLRFVINRSMLPFHLDIEDTAGNVLVSIVRGWTFWMSEIQLLDSSVRTIGFIKQKWAFLKPKFDILNTQRNLLATIQGDWKAWNFVISDANNKEIGTINKKWAGLAREVFTTADKYYVKIRPEYKEDMTKVNILTAAITIDMVLKENSNR